MKLKTSIEQKLNDHFQPRHMEVVNESHKHNVPPGSESHFKVLLVSEAFEGQKPVARHRSVNKVLAVELNNGVHALALKLVTPAQWEAAGHTLQAQSPPCAHR